MKKSGITCGLWAVIVTLSLPWRADALAPHELLVIVNQNEADSVTIAKTYAEQRQIPACNLVMLDMPRWIPDKSHAIKPEDFTRLIWAPVTAAAKARGLEDHILAWIYSTHFPYRIVAQPSLSVQGLTFLRNRMPNAKAVAEGTYDSPVFAGPDAPGGNVYGPQTLDSMRELLRDDMPLPAMALGYLGPRGNTKAEILACLKTGLQSDQTHPDRTIYFSTNDDVRSRCRHWQFPGAARGLQRRGIHAVITQAFPEGKTDVLGVMMGSPNVTPATIGRFQPGCMAEHLTSAAAVFDSTSQTKCSAWIRAGATASAGTVCEPMSYWSKFPNARFFNHYAAGCTMLESFYQSIRCPLQIMLLGDPLASPWAPDASLVITGITAGETISALREVSLKLDTKSGIHFRHFVFLIDGRIHASTDATVTLDPVDLEPGAHTLRAVAYRTGFVRNPIFDVVAFRTESP